MVRHFASYSERSSTNLLREGAIGVIKSGDRSDFRATSCGRTFETEQLNSVGQRVDEPLIETEGVTPITVGDRALFHTDRNKKKKNED